jgi:hypothetical protein
MEQVPQILATQVPSIRIGESTPVLAAGLKNHHHLIYLVVFERARLPTAWLLLLAYGYSGVHSHLGKLLVEHQLSGFQKAISRASL